MSITFTPNQLLIHSFIIRCTKASDNYIGLFYGKLGASIIYYEYGRLEDNPAYTRYADSLLDKIWSNIHKNTPLSLDSGVFGIGWGLEYLIQNKFVDGLGIDICEEVNEKIIQLDPRRITDFSLETGLLGLIHYMLIHIKGCKQQKVPLAFDNTYLTDVKERAKNLCSNNTTNKSLEIIETYKHFVANNILNYSPSISLFSDAGDINKKGKSIGLAHNEIIDKLIKKR